jgi:hypothetical protein
MIALSVCNKPFIPLGISSGRVKSRKSLTEMLPTNIMQNHIIQKTKILQKQWF